MRLFEREIANLIDDEQLRPSRALNLARETILCDRVGHAPGEVYRSGEVDAMPNKVFNS